jgi:SAM-dependent methyltransferase
LAQDRPFGVERFDYMYALEVIEHVDCEDGLWRLLPDYAEARRDFLESCLDMLKPAGRLLISTSNRLCPLDIGHGHHYSRLTDVIVRRTKIPLTLPWHKRNFVVSYGDMVRLLQATKYRGSYLMRPIPASGYLAYSRVDTSFVRFVVNAYMTLMSLPSLRTSFFNPLLIVEIEKTSGSGSFPNRLEIGPASQSIPLMT